MKTLKRLLFVSIILFGFYEGKAQTQFEMNQEANEKYLKADKELNKVYKQLTNILDKEERALLTKAQKDWIKYRDSHCDFDAQLYEGGSMRPMVYSYCLLDRTEARIKDLKASIENRSDK